MATTYLYTATDKIEVINCARCGVQFGVVEEWLDRRREDGKRFYCPKGCLNVYHDTTIDRLQRRVRTLEREESELRDGLRASKRDTTTARAATTRVKNRAKKGVCLYCHRTIKQMKKHVEDKHPEHVGA